MWKSCSGVMHNAYVWADDLSCIRPIYVPISRFISFSLSRVHHSKHPISLALQEFSKPRSLHTFTHTRTPPVPNGDKSIPERPPCLRLTQSLAQSHNRTHTAQSKLDQSLSPRLLWPLQYAKSHACHMVENWASVAEHQISVPNKVGLWIYMYIHTHGLTQTGQQMHNNLDQCNLRGAVLKFTLHLSLWDLLTLASDGSRFCALYRIPEAYTSFSSCVSNFPTLHSSCTVFGTACV